MPDNVHIFVYVTKTNKFRARITEPGSIFEVTIGGESWRSGKGKKYRHHIIIAMAKILSHLHVHYETCLKEKGTADDF